MNQRRVEHGKEGRKDNKRRTEGGGGKETERKERNREWKRAGVRERKRKRGTSGEEKRASGIAARFRDYSPAEDHREDYTLAAVWRGSARSVSAHRTTRAALKRRG